MSGPAAPPSAPRRLERERSSPTQLHPLASAALLPPLIPPPRHAAAPDHHPGSWPTPHRPRGTPARHAACARARTPPPAPRPLRRHPYPPAAASTDAPPSPSSSPAAATPPGVDIAFDNSDASSSLLTLRAPGADDLLAEATATLDALGLAVQSAAVHRDASDATRATLTFRITTGPASGQLPPDRHPSVKSALAALWGGAGGGGGGALSSLPAIYGVAAEAEVKRLRPLSTGADGDAAALELAAAEMAQAAAQLVAVEREVKLAGDRAVGGGAATADLDALASRRAEAAAILERRMAAMEAVLASRRTAIAPAAPEPEREAPSNTVLDALLSTPPSSVRRSPSSGPAAGSGKEIMLQGFNWESHRESWYMRIVGEAQRYADDGFTMVWMPPPSDSVSAQGYLPRDLYCLDSQYGSESDLRAAVAALHAAGLRAVADVVINHRCAHKQDPQGRWNVYGGRLPWDASAICCGNPAFGGTGAHKTGDDYTAAPNIDHTSPKVREDLTRWLTWLRTSIGFDGWRFDYVKGYSGEFVKQYVDATVPDVAVGEFWDTCGYTDGVLDYNQDTHRQRTINWCDRTGGTAAAFDFTTKGVLQEAMARGELWRLADAAGRPPGVMGLWPSRAVTFIDNHDTGSTLNHWPFPAAHLGAGYAYILTHPGTPCVFYDHWNSNGLGDAIRDLMRVRREAGLHCRSKVVIRVAVGTVYAATIDDAVAIKIGPGDWSPTAARVEVGQKDWLLEASGHQWAVWRAIK